MKLKIMSILLAMAFVFSLSGLAMLPGLAMAADPDIDLDPDSGRIDRNVEVTGDNFDDYDGDDVYFYFTDEDLDEGDDWDEDDIDHCEYLGKEEVDNDEVEFDFDVPDEMTDGDEDEDVNDDDYFVVVVDDRNDGEVLAVADFECTGESGGGDGGDITIDPDEGNIGEEVEVEGEDFDDYEDEYVYIYFTDEDLDEDDDWELDKVDHAEYLGREKVDDDYEISFDFDVPSRMTDGDDDPEDVEEGDYYIVVTDDDEDGYVLAVDSFDVVAPPSEISLSTGSGIVGTSIRVSGEDFAAGRTVSIYFGGARMGTKNTDSGGSFTFTFTVPANPAGDHKIVVRDTKNNDGEATFEVVPNFSLNPTRAAPENSVSVSGTGFGESVGVTIYLGNTGIGSTSTRSNGGFSASITIPAVSAGSQTIKARDADGNERSATLNVIAAFSVSPTEVNVGTEVTAKGIGFAGNRTVTITYDGAKVGEDKTTTNGSFTAVLKIPTSPGGDHKIAVDDGAGNRAEATVTMEATSPAGPRIQSPAPNEKVGTPPAFSWSGSTDPSGVSYSLQIAETEDFSLPIITKTNLNATEYVLAENEVLSNGGYYLRVKALDGAGNESTWSTPVPFNVGTLPSWLPLWLLIVLVVVVIVIIGGVVLMVIRPL